MPKMIVPDKPSGFVYESMGMLWMVSRFGNVFFFNSANVLNAEVMDFDLSVCWSRTRVVTSGNLNC